MLGKRKRSLQPQQHSLRQVLTQQIDLEIALKTRLSVAAHARLEWANILKDSIVHLDSSSASHGYPPTAYRDAALTAYEAIEAPCRVVASALESTSQPLSHGKPLVSEVPRTRKRVTLGLIPGSSTGPLLFEDRSTSTPVTLKLACTDCSRSDFPTMQGFLNHCRLAHSRIYGTHDECIQATGVIIDGNEREALLEAGLDIHTIHLPSLKGLFERAVGLQRTNLPSLSEAMEPSHLSEEPSTHLSQTLGLHKDTPTLAPFLGKQIKKKCIHVYDPLEAVDICSHDDEAPPTQRARWIVKHRPRRGPEREWSINLAALAIEKTGGTEVPQHVLSEPLHSQVSRFHITRRILVSDRSLYLPENKRPIAHKSHTHRWQVSVSSPSYEQHITTFLLRLTVACITQPPVFHSPISIPDPPFVACGTTDRPFLARLTFEWAGEQNHTFEVEHWVELDQLKAARPALGEEQIYDVELDRNTMFLPVRDGPNTVSWNGDGDHNNVDAPDGSVFVSQDLCTANALSLPEPEHFRLLKKIVPRFPMTLQELGSRQSPNLPYNVYPSRAKLLSLVPGRRKAVEWNRALAIRTEYEAVQASSAISLNKVQLSTADVYRWLDKEGLFPRRRVRIAKSPARLESPQPTASSSQSSQAVRVFCPVCGVDGQHHAPGIPVNSHGQSQGETTAFRCPTELEWHRARLIHVYALLAPPRIPYGAFRSDHPAIISNSARELVDLAQPHLTRFVHQEVTSLSLSCWSDMLGADKQTQTPSLPNELWWGTKQEIEQALSPSALIAIVVKNLIRDVIGSAVRVAREMQSRTKVTSNQTRDYTPTSLLTPTHVLQGLLIKDSDLGGSKEAIFKCFLRVGTLLEVDGVRAPGNLGHHSGSAHRIGTTQHNSKTN